MLVRCATVLIRLCAMDYHLAETWFELAVFLAWFAAAERAVDNRAGGCWYLHQSCPREGGDGDETDREDSKQAQIIAGTCGARSATGASSGEQSERR
jgi:hypothetical protein